MSVLHNLVISRTLADVAARNEKGTYNAADLNRVGLAMGELAETFRGYGYSVSVSSRRDWAMGETPTQADMALYLRDVEALRGTVAVLVTTPETPNSMACLDYVRANEIEKILVDVDDSVHRMVQAWFYAGEIYSGQF